MGKGGAAAQQEEPGGGGADARGMGLAAKMMEKMGWRGGGLGRDQQVPPSKPLGSKPMQQLEIGWRR